MTHGLSTVCGGNERVGTVELAWTAWQHPKRSISDEPSKATGYAYLIHLWAVYAVSA